MSVCLVMVGAGDAAPLGVPLGIPLGVPLGIPLGVPLGAPLGCAAAGLLALLETHPAVTTIARKVSGGAAIKTGVRRQKGFWPCDLRPGVCPALPGSGASGPICRVSSLISSPKPSPARLR